MPRSRFLDNARTLAPVLGSTARAVAADLVARVRPGAAAPESSVDVPAPTGVDEYARHVHAQRAIPASVADVVELVTDLDRAHEWLTLHLSWRGERPARIETGAEFTQQIKLMDIPAQARWTVARAGEDGFELRGTGPMGITVGLWCTVVPDGTGAAVRLDGALDGSPVRGPVGLTAVRSVEVALSESLAAIDAIVGGSATLRVPDEPVLHERTGTLLDPTTPVLVGVGQLVQRTPDLESPREPVELSVAALRSAAEDAGARIDLLASADMVYAVPSASWTYGSQAGRVAELVGATEARTVQTSPYGGDGAQLAVNDAAQQVVDGHAQVVLVSGAEAGATVAALQSKGREPQWQRQEEGAAPDRVIGIDRPANNSAETSAGIGAPIFVYALLESALRGAAGADADEHQKRIAELWARASEVAAGNPYAWDPTARSADEIGNPSPDNRRVSDPYTKLMCANLQVDLAAGVIVMSAAAAQAAGVDQDKWVFLHAGASATDEWFVSERADLASSPAIKAAAGAALGHAGITPADLGPVDLYSCFPAAVQLGAAAVGLPWDDPSRPLSVTGGLTFAGGPGNSYGLHAVATMVPQLRENPDEYGLSSSLGWYATKHALGVYSGRPPAQRFAHLKPVFDRPPARPALTELEGTAVVEAVTVPYQRSGEPEAVVVSAIKPTGERVLLRREDPADIELLTSTDPLRREIRIEADRVVLGAEDRLELPPPPPAKVRTERVDDSILVVTLDRPKVKNAIDRDMALALERAVDDAEADDTVRVIVLTGADNTFCAGMDLAGANRGEVPVTDRRGPLGLTAEPPVKPTIAAVEGHALAGGFELALCADLVVAAENSEFGLPEAKRGLLAAAGGLWRTAVRLPRAVALELALVADAVPATRLAELGLVNRVVAPGTALDEALDLARGIAANAPLSVSVGKQIIDAAPTWSPEEGFQKQSEMASPVVLSDDAREGVAAFAEKRAPRWTGR
ncbi:acetyl-CoA C-acetyltransferase [Nocardioides sp. J9]|uniref:type II toxin-antitoxin system Rv0910 family toxin n=1 Tax=Nocardioides sp. J9 TaxID=935844 RepID=UPI0011ACED46|nr:crotonase/enoyl-CoA hydratase family protein [Nocardioides sp. J9]TWG94792.1 acetyl-CoA C-acetyltransferase [Nocardioides sp. J9]